ncbi:MAG: LptA/OstA family protein, partial [Victivallales bacterium]|nr:LptA/OstA family protein [Victivallales bacterium]
MIFKRKFRRFRLAAVWLCACFGLTATLQAFSPILNQQRKQPYSFMLPLDSTFQEKDYLKAEQQKLDANADNMEFIGNNVIASGNVVIKYQDIVIAADKAIVNLKNKDIDAGDNISLRRPR